MPPPDELTINQSAARHRVDLDNESWVALVDRFVRDADGEFASFHDEFRWRETEVLNYDRHMVSDRRTSGHLNEGSPTGHSWPVRQLASR